MSQGRYWLLTIPHHDYTPYLHQNVSYLRGQVESGAGTGYLHWQLLAAFNKKVRLAGVKAIFGDTCHAELSRSDAADEYVWKDDTAVEGTRFELGKRALKRNSGTDWASIWTMAKCGRIEEIPANVRVVNYKTLRNIEKVVTFTCNII